MGGTLICEFEIETDGIGDSVRLKQEQMELCEAETGTDGTLIL